MRSRANQRLAPALGSRQHAAGECRQQPRANRRRLPAARRSDHGEQRRAHEPRDQLGDQPLAPEEVLGVGRVERGQPGERTDRRQRGRADLAAVAPRELLERLQTRADRRTGPPRPTAARRARCRRGRRSPRSPPTPAPAPSPARRDARPAGRLRSPLRGRRPEAPRTPRACTGKRSRPRRRLRAGRARAGAPVGRRRSPAARAPGAARGPTAAGARWSRERGSALEHLDVGIVGVVHDQQGRPLARPPARPWARRPHPRRAPPRRRRSASRASSCASRVFPMPRGPETNARPPRPSHASATSATSSASSRSRPASNGEPPSSPAGRSVRPGGASSAGSWARIALLQRPQLGVRLDADLLDQRRPRPAVRLKRLRLATAAVQREHELAVKTLAQWLLRHRRLQLGDQIRMPAESELRVDPRLERRPPSLLQPGDLRLGERLEGQVGQRGASPQPERLPQSPRLLAPDRFASRRGRARPAPRNGRRRARQARRATGTRSRGSPAGRCGRAPAAGPTPGCAASCGPSAEATPPTAPRPADRSRATRWRAAPATPAAHAGAQFRSPS